MQLIEREMPQRAGAAEERQKKKKAAKTVTDEQLLSNLTAVADRRQDDTKVQEEITKALSETIAACFETE